MSPMHRRIPRCATRGLPFGPLPREAAAASHRPCCASPRQRETIAAQVSAEHKATRETGGGVPFGFTIGPRGGWTCPLGSSPGLSISHRASRSEACIEWHAGNARKGPGCGEAIFGALSRVKKMWNTWLSAVAGFPGPGILRARKPPFSNSPATTSVGCGRGFA